jgi:uroporphyrinogen decarboxylase
MTSRERVLTAFAHQEPDRVPLDYLANPEIDVALKWHYGLADDDSEGLALKLGTDFRGCYVSYVGPALHSATPGTRVNEWGVRTRWIEHPAGGYWDFCDFPLAGTLTKARVDAWPMPSPDDYHYDSLRPYRDAHPDYPIVLGGAGVACIINRIGQFRGMPDALCDVVTEDPIGLRLIDRMLDIDFEIVRRALAAVGDRVHIFCMGEDLGTQRGPIISPETYRKVIKPRHQRFIDEAKRYDLLVMFHCCGSSSWAFDDLADMGVDIVDTLQPEAADMDPAFLKATYGHKLCFHGMMSTAGVLAFGTPEQVREEVQHLLDLMMPGGGFALCPTHLIQSNSPVANVVAMYDAARELGVY